MMLSIKCCAIYNTFCSTDIDEYTLVRPLYAYEYVIYVNYHATSKFVHFKRVELCFYPFKVGTNKIAQSTLKKMHEQCGKKIPTGMSRNFERNSDLKVYKRSDKIDVMLAEIQPKQFMGWKLFCKRSSIAFYFFSILKILRTLNYNSIIIGDIFLNNITYNNFIHIIDFW